MVSVSRSHGFQMHSRHRVAAWVAAVTLLALSASPLVTQAAAAAAPSPKRQVSQAFALLSKETRTLSKSVASRRTKSSLLKLAKRARKQSRRRPCASIKTLRKFRRGLRRVKRPRARGAAPTAGSERGQLEALAFKANVALMQLPRARRCGGGKRARVDEASSTVLTSNERELRMRVQLPAPTFAPQQVGGREFLQIVMEGAGETGDEGKPGIPTLTKHFGVPDGADISLKINGAQGYNVQGINLYPHQPQPVDQKQLPNEIAGPGSPDRGVFQNPPFEIDQGAYRSNARFPAQPSHAGPLGDIRGLKVGGVDFAGAQYRPRSDTLRVFTSIDVTVNFTGDNRGHFGERSDLGNDWSVYFNRFYEGVLVNHPAIFDRIGDIRDTRFCGEELLVITSNELRPAADTFAANQEAQGFETSVFEVGSPSVGSTNTQIRDFIRGRINGSCLLRPSYVVLFGNTAHVPTFLVPCSPGGDPDQCNIASDLDYSLDGTTTDLFADVMLGRIPSPSLDNANGVVTKINNYETTGPTVPPGDDFFDRAAVTSYFQPPLHCVLNEGETGTPNCDGNNPPVTGHWEINYPANTDTRGFTITSERIRNGIAADGHSVDRLYTTDDEDVNPLYYWNGTPIPNHLRRPTFGWDANTTDFFNAYNDGRFVILHRDHGWPDGWAEPTLHSGHVPFFTNGSQQPVVFGINCSSAAFDNPAHPSFVELQVLRENGGAIAGFGDTRVSPSFPNNHMALGFFDAMFPRTVTGYGSETETRRLGEILVRGKQYMASQEGFEYHGSGDTYVEHYLYHLLGDPTMQMWADPPQRFDVDKIRVEWRQFREPIGPGPWWEVLINFPAGGPDPPPLGTVVTLFQGAQAVGRGVVGPEGSLTVRPETNIDPNGLTLSYQQDGVMPAQDTVDNQPSPIRTDTSLNCPDGSVFYAGATFTGRVDPALAGRKVRVVYTQKTNTGERKIEHNTTTDANGEFSDDVNLDQEAEGSPFEGTWRAQAFYDGERGTAPSQSNACQFNVRD
jgi:hypothetical protein